MESKDVVSKDKNVLNGDETCDCGEKEGVDVNQHDGLSVQERNKQGCISEMGVEADCKDVVGKTGSMGACSDNAAQAMDKVDNVKEVNVLKEKMELNGYQQENPMGNPQVNPTGNPPNNSASNSMNKQVNGQAPHEGGSTQQGGYVDPAAYAAWQHAMWVQQQQAAAQRAAQVGPWMGSGMFQGMPYHRGVFHQAQMGVAAPPPFHVHHPKHDEHKYGQLLQVAQKFATGTFEPQDVATGLSIIQDAGDQFWKGLLVGGVAALILGSESVRKGLFSMFSKDDKNN